MLKSLPETYQDFTELGWDQIEPHTDALLQRVLSTDTISNWLKDWTQLTCLITECFLRLQIRTTTHTNDKDATSLFLDYSENIMPNARSFEQKMINKLLDSGLEPENYSIPIRKMRSDSSIFREKNLPLQTETESLITTWQEIEAARVIIWDGEELPPKQVFDKLAKPERSIRERAIRELYTRAVQDRKAIDEIWVKLIDLRSEIANNAGFDDFRSYQWQKLARFDYSPEDCLSFQKAIQEIIVPVVSRLRNKHKERLGVETLRVWDDHWFIRPDSSGLSPLIPFQTIDELSERIEKIFTNVAPSFGEYYRIMVDEGLLDLDTRKHKAPGAYMEELPASKYPFVFSSATNTSGDVSTLLHEGGHAFHMLEAVHWPFHYQSSLNHMPVEFVEVGSMAMELLAYPYLTSDQGGFYSEEDAARAKIEHLEIILGFFPYMAVVDAFQHWVYENLNEARDTTKCDEVWAKIHQQYLPHLDWTGIEDTLKFGWRLQGHIFFSPFYYVEYGLAQLGAIQIWENAQIDQEKAVRAYRKALALGNTASLPDLFKAAGAKFAFDAGTLKRAVDLVEKTIFELEQTD